MSKKFTFLVTDETVNNRGFRILTDGIDTTQFEKNPVGYFMHDRRTWNPQGDEVICRWENLQKLKNGIMMADAVFDENDEKAMKIAKKIENNFLRMASVGIDPIEWSEDTSVILKGQTRPTITKSKLLEISIVDRGGNDNALVRLSSDNKDNFELPLINNTQMELKQQLEKVLNLGANDDIVNTVTQLKSDADYKSKYEALVQKNQERYEAEAIALVQKGIDAKCIKEEQKDSYLALFKADHANAKTIVEGMLQSNPSGKQANQVGEFLGGLDNKAAKAEDKDYAWYEKNDPEALLQMKAKEPEKFQKLFDEHFK